MMMHRTRVLLLALAFGASSVAAQAPIYVDLSPSTSAQDVTVVQDASGAADVVVVGTRANGSVFRWTLSTLVETSLGATAVDGAVRVSADGARVVATTLGMDGIARGARFDGATWTQGPGLGATSGTSESVAYAISGDGAVVAGTAWAPGTGARAWTWAQPASAANLGGAAMDPPSRVNAANADGFVVVGWKEKPDGTRQGARWVGGALQPQFTFDGRMLGEALGVNASGDVVVGTRIVGGLGANASAAWRYSAGTTSPLENLVGSNTVAVATDVTDDGALIVGHSGAPLGAGTRDIVWTAGAPRSLREWLISLGTTGVQQYPDLGYVAAISGDGAAICGRGTGIASPGGPNQPRGGWVVIFPSALPNGTPFCAGDGSGAACPCANSGSVGRGCASSVNPAGAQLRATGASSLSADSLTLAGSGMPNSSALYFQGTSEIGAGAGVAFGDGLRCAGGTIVRLATKSNATGSSSYPGAGDPPVSVRGGVTGTGSVRLYQVWYRNAAAFCTPSTFNLSNGLRITWGA